jgi:glutamyl-tRNA synthetase
VQSAGGKWDQQRLDFFNGVWIRKLSVDELLRRLEPFVPREWDRDVLREIVPHIQERMKRLTEAKDQIEFLFVEDLEYDAALLVPEGKDAGETIEALARTSVILRHIEPFTGATIEPALKAVADELGWKFKPFSVTVRVAVTGRKVGPPLYESLDLLDKDRSLRRIEEAQELLGSRD